MVIEGRRCVVVWGVLLVGATWAVFLVVVVAAAAVVDWGWSPR